LGGVDQPVSVTQPAPTSPLSNAVGAVTVTIGGQKATTSFAGLTPGFTGLYQINAVVPGGVAPGDAVEVTISVAGQVSPVVSMSVR
jgi:adhesin/invasin